jgi:hypothetical protein
MQDFTGINAKLERAAENIENLYSEMVLFFLKCDYPVPPKDNDEMLSKATEHFKNLPVPPRFGVLVGEINHQLRSCFDHIVWHFSQNSIANIKNIRKIEFPVFEERPANHDSRSLFEGKIKGVTDSGALALIERLQPYNAANPFDSSLWIIHDFDIVDKHRELILDYAPATATAVPGEMRGVMECYKRANPELNAADVARHFESHGTPQFCIAFRNFGRRGAKSVTEGLIELFLYTSTAVEDFGNL